MYEVLKNNISRKVKISDEQFEKVLSFIKPQHLKKKQKILSEGDINRYSIFVAQGSLRSYTIDKKGVEHVVQFALEDHWIADLYSLITGTPTDLYIEALEDSEVLLLPGEIMEELYAAVPPMERVFRLLMQNAYVATLKRLKSTLQESAEERYLELVRAYPNIVQRVAQVHIASYLGITPESLSRIRKQLVSK